MNIVKCGNLVLILKKTKIIVFSKRKFTNYPAFIFGHKHIGVVDDYVYLRCAFPADTLRNNDVVITSKRRHFDVITSKWRCFDVITTSLLRHVFRGFNHNGTFHKAIAKQVSQAKKAYYYLIKKVIKYKLPVDIVLELFDQLVMTAMLYGSEVWCFSDITHIGSAVSQIPQRVIRG